MNSFHITLPKTSHLNIIRSHLWPLVIAWKNNDLPTIPYCLKCFDKIDSLHMWQCTTSNSVFKPVYGCWYWGTFKTYKSFLSYWFLRTLSFSFNLLLIKVVCMFHGRSWKTKHFFLTGSIDWYLRWEAWGAALHNKLCCAKTLRCS